MPKFMRVKFLVAACAFLPYTVLSAAETEPQKLPLDFSPEPGITVSVEEQKGKIRLRVGKEKAIEIGELDPASEMTGNKPVIVADFNFDGAADLAVLDGIGYNGVNMFYRLYLWEKGKQRFREIKETISNPVLYKDKSLILSAQRSGPRWYQTIFRVVNGEIYRFADAQMLNNPTLWGITFSDSAGKPGRRAVVAAAWFEKLTLPLPVFEADYSPALCNGDKAPAKGTPNKDKIRVKLLDFREEGGEVQIEAGAGKKLRWVNADCFAVDD